MLLKDLWRGRSPTWLWREVSMTAGQTIKWKKQKTMGGFLLLIYFFWAGGWVGFFFSSPQPPSTLKLDKWKIKTFHVLVSKLFDRRCNLVFQLYLVCLYWWYASSKHVISCKRSLLSGQEAEGGECLLK